MDNENIKTAKDAGSEIEAMASIAQTLGPLDNDAKKRVLSWVCEYFNVENVVCKPTETDSKHHNDNDGHVEFFSDVAELFDATDPKTAAEKALIVGYWLQTKDGQESFSSQSVNTELKNLGHGVTNITAAFTDLLNSKLALQVQKSGKSQQARKKYKLTRKGILHVEKMAKQNNEETEM